MSLVLDPEEPTAIGVADKQGDLLDDVARFCDEALPERSICGFLRRESGQLFPDEAFAEELIADLLGDDDGNETTGRSSTKCPMRWSMTTRVTAAGQPSTGTVPTARARSSPASRVKGIEAKCKTQGLHMTSGLFDKDRLEVNVTDGTVTCPAGVTVSIGRSTDGGLARFAEVCSSRALRPQCTKAAVAGAFSSGRAKRCWSERAHATRIPRGSLTTEPRASRLSASLPISCAASTGDDEQWCAVACESTTTSG